ncbi:pyridine nucleotide-disulfide oxidoreductase domain-containing protein [Ditylenchus destructor]|uniref:Pyridine nucleotide-disulfide oxidoreductase domain-containing protein n=1 Tax=Ditylenchus destructor TaxID=166010 RepID=A0AAD4MHI8_9BILA|nr:pyridine nucleotide-disulfide oxidoreductase domain-containing protein [Ditylenchus destructor]
MSAPKRGMAAAGPSHAISRRLPCATSRRARRARAVRARQPHRIPGLPGRTGGQCRARTGVRRGRGRCCSPGSATSPSPHSARTSTNASPRIAARTDWRTPMQHDVIVIGGSFAGLAAATYLARARRDVAVIDADKPRNRFAAVSHGFLGHDGSAPHTILATARAQLAAYPSASLTQGRVAEARRNGDGFAVTLADGSERTAHN